MLEFKELETFVWVARLGGFRAAACKLNTTQPSISSRIARIESVLGVSLFDRGPRGTVLTAKGRELLGYAERLISIREEINAVVGSPHAMRGIVRLGVSETIVHTWLSRFIERLHATSPNVTLEIEVDTSPHLREALLSQRLDAAFLLGPLADPRTKSLLLSTYPLSFIARPDIGDQLAPARASVADLRCRPVITYARNTRPYMNVRDALTIPGEPAPRIYANASLSTIIRMARDGIGIAAIPATLADAEIQAGLLKIIDSDVNLDPLTFTATWLADVDDLLVQTVVETACSVASSEPARAHTDRLG